jgi:protein Xni
MKKLLLIDLPNLLKRNWHGAGLKADEDLPALAATVKGTLKHLIAEERPDHVVGTVDMPNCWRLDYHPGYKNGPGREEGSGPTAHHLVELMAGTFASWGLCVAHAPRNEADDVNATLAHQAYQAEMAVTVYTKDSDQVQLARGTQVVVRYAAKKGEPDIILDAEKVVELYGVESRQIPDLKTLLAYPKDNLRGALGLPPGTRCAFTTKRALELLQLYPDFGHIWDARADLAEREREWLVTHADGLAKLLTIARLNHQAAVVRSGPSATRLLRLS